MHAEEFNAQRYVLHMLYSLHEWRIQSRTKWQNVLRRGKNWTYQWKEIDPKITEKNVLFIQMNYNARSEVPVRYSQGPNPNPNPISNPIPNHNPNPNH